jgi:hypothetical protein
MANVLDVVLETTKVLSPVLVKKVVPAETKRRPKPKLGKPKLRKFKLKPKLVLLCPLRQSLP